MIFSGLTKEMLGYRFDDYYEFEKRVERIEEVNNGLYKIKLREPLPEGYCFATSPFSSNGTIFHENNNIFTFMTLQKNFYSKLTFMSEINRSLIIYKKDEEIRKGDICFCLAELNVPFTFNNGNITIKKVVAVKDIYSGYVHDRGTRTCHKSADSSLIPLKEIEIEVKIDTQDVIFVLKPSFSLSPFSKLDNMRIEKKHKNSITIKLMELVKEYFVIGLFLYKFDYAEELNKFLSQFSIETQEKIIKKMKTMELID